MKERNYLLPLFAIGIGVFFLAVLVTGIVVWNRMPVIVGAPPPSATPPPPTLAPTPTPTPLPTPTPIPTEIVAADPATTATTATTPTSDIPNAEASVARLRSGFRRCYNRGLETNPSLEGAITLTIIVSPTGDVMGVTKTGSIDPTVDDCILKVARTASFAASRSGGKVNVPVRFARLK